MNFSAKTVVVIAIGAALYGIGGLPMFGVPVFANTTLKPAMAVLALFSVLCSIWPYRWLSSWLYRPLGNGFVRRLGRVVNLGFRLRYRRYGYRLIPYDD